MIKMASRWIILGYVWNKYRWIIKSLCLYLVLAILIFTMHSEYMSYCKTIEQQACHVGLSFITKWLSLFVITLVLAISIISLKLRSKKTEEVKLDSSRQLLEDDGFDSIRFKDKLVSRGERIIQSKPCS